VPAPAAPPPRAVTRRLFGAVLLAGLPGVAAFAGLALPALLQDEALPVPMWVLVAGAGVQSALLLAVAAVVGSVLAPRVGLRAPVCEALSARTRPWPALRPQLQPGLLGGLACAAVLVGVGALGPPELRAAQAAVPLPLPVRVLYGGVTEEVLMRWGLMTVPVWLAWRVRQGGRGRPSAPVVAAGIGAAALLYGLAHLPAVQAVLGPLPAGLALVVVASHATVGVVTGWLYHRHGLESAMVAHGGAHLLAWVAGH